MSQLSPAGLQAVNDIAQRTGFSPDAVTSMLYSVINGNGSMAQFSHPEFGGSGQWMAGGMTMVSDMFNNALKYRVDGLCQELSALVAREPGLTFSGSFQSQNQGGGYQTGSFQSQSSGGNFGGGFGGNNSLFVPQPNNGNWWPGDLGAPSSVGAQNSVRYAYFPGARRLAIDLNGQVTVYDTLDHQIGGFGQQQSGSGSLTFSSQYGTVDVASLPVVSGAGQSFAPQASVSYPAPSQQPASAPLQQSGPSGQQDILAAIEKLADFHAKGILSEQEFLAKKAELLGRL